MMLVFLPYLSSFQSCKNLLFPPPAGEHYIFQVFSINLIALHRRSTSCQGGERISCGYISSCIRKFLPLSCKTSLKHTETSYVSKHHGAAMPMSACAVEIEVVREV